MKKAILIGDYEKAPYHSLKGIDEAVSAIIKEHFEVFYTADYDYFEESHLSPYDLLILYVDFGNEPLTPQQVAGIQTFVSRGGGILVLHNGISVGGKYELAQLIGAKFAGHPEYQTLKFSMIGNHPITVGLDHFTMDEEPYLFELDNFTEKTVIMAFELDGQMMPAAWTLTYGMGKLVYLVPGHHLQSFENETYNEIILRSCLWACNAI